MGCSHLDCLLENFCNFSNNLAGILAREMGKGKILPRHVLLAVKNDIELDKLLAGAILDGGGVKPHIESVLLE